jgi:hypothetical protein
MHYTASNLAITPKRKLGRLPVFMRRFARNSGTPGIHFGVWDGKMPQFEEIRKKYSVFDILGCDVFFWGTDVAYYHGNDANGWAIGVENRNIGKLKKKNGKFYWHKTVEYKGRAPVQVRGIWCEPYTKAQVEANILILRWLKDLYPIQTHRVLGHLHITSNRTDPMPHWPLGLVRIAGCKQPDTALEQLKWLEDFEDDPDFYKRYDEWTEEEAIEDVDPDQVFGREERPDMEFEDDEDLYGKDKKVSKGNVEEIKRALRQLDYYPGNPGEDDAAEIFRWTLKLFQNRWVKRKNGRWIKTMKDTGKPDEQTALKLNQMLKQWKFV